MLLASMLVLAAFVEGGGAAAPPAPAAPVLKHHEGPMAKVLEDAKAAGRPVMIDFYTDWCGWCKVMDKEVFTDKGVAETCNDGFLVFRVDAEKGEGPDLAKKYGVDGFPTFVFVDAAGEELDRHVGYAPKEKFLPVLADIKAGNHLKGLREKVAKDPKDAVTQAKLGIKLAPLGEDEAWEHLEKAVELDAKDANPSTIDARFWLAVLEMKRDSSPDSLAAFAKKYPEHPSAVDAHRILVMIARQQQDEDAQVASLEVIVKKAPDAQSRNELSWLLATRGKDLDRALGLVEEALKAEPKNSAYLDTRAECLSRLGRHDEAVKAQEAAVANLPKGIKPEERVQYEDRLAEFTKKRDEAKKAGDTK